MPSIVLVHGAVALLGVLLTLGQQAEPAPLRQVDWPSVLASDPALAIDSEAQSFAPGPIGPYVRLVDSPAPDQPQIAGFALLDDVLYGDLDGDGAEEAAIMLFSGGTAGVTGLLVYHADQPGPRLAASLGGYKMGARIDDGSLVVLQPRYAGFEPNCCPSALMETHYSLVGPQLVASSEEEQPLVEAQAETVQQFYTALDSHALADAYSYLSDAFQHAQPFEAWAAGYASTERVQLDEVSQAADGVKVTFTAHDRAVDGSDRAQHFQGAWSLVWGAAVHHWLLDAANITQVP